MNLNLIWIKKFVSLNIFILSGETMALKEEISLPSQRLCIRCNFVSSQEVCKACVLLEGLNKGLPKLGIGKSSKAKKMLDEYNAKQKSILEETIKDINDEYKKNNCVSKGKVCRSSCKNKSHITQVNGESHSKTESCCNGQCSEKLNNSVETNSKVQGLLKEYVLSESTHNGQTPEKLNDNYEFDIDTHITANELTEDDDTCGGACGKIGSLHIGF